MAEARVGPPSGQQNCQKKKETSISLVQSMDQHHYSWALPSSSWRFRKYNRSCWSLKCSFVWFVDFGSSFGPWQAQVLLTWPVRYSWLVCRERDLLWRRSQLTHTGHARHTLCRQAPGCIIVQTTLANAPNTTNAAQSSPEKLDPWMSSAFLGEGSAAAVLAD